MTRVVITEFPNSAEREIDVEREILGSDVDIVQYRYDGDREKLISACKDADVLLADCTPLPRSVIENLPSCRLVSFAATGFDSIDLDAAAKADIRVCAIDEYCTDEVADHAVLLILSLCRRLLEFHERVQTEKLWQIGDLAGLSRLADLTLGIIGFGRIGQAVARRARAFGMTVIAHDHHPRQNIADEIGVRFCSFEELLGNADVVSMNCRLTDENENMIDSKAFQMMRRRPIFVNCARGGLVDEAALIVALDSGQISAAGIDVLANEFPDLNESKFIGRNNVILTPHMAFYSDASILESRKISAKNIRNFLDSKHADVRRYVCHGAG
jgi:phosphoglycerate dehydrogenase-like enzyme